MSSTRPLIRVCRKRSADPQTALLVSIKRSRVGEEQVVDPLLFSYCATQDSPHVPPEIRVIDYSEKTVARVPNFANTFVQQIDETDPLSNLNEAVGEVGGLEPSCSVEREVITCNGVPMVCGEEDFVYDFYEMRKGNANTADNADDLEMRFMSKEEFQLWMEAGSDSDDDCADDDDDSNDENNWRNDYPDEESCSDEDDDTYSDGESEREEWDCVGIHRLSIREHGLEQVDTDDEDEDD